MSSSHTETLQLFLLDSGEGERLLRMEGELDFASVQLLRETLIALEDRPLVLDLAGLAFMDSTGLAVLLDHWRRQTPDRGRLRLQGVSGQILALLTRTGTLALLAGPAHADASG